MTAYDLVKNGWCQRAFARNAAGEEVAYHSPDATMFCILGALGRIYTSQSPAYWQAYDRVRNVIPGGSSINVTPFNDASKRTKKEVLAVLRKAGV